MRVLRRGARSAKELMLIPVGQKVDDVMRCSISKGTLILNDINDTGRSYLT